MLQAQTLPLLTCVNTSTLANTRSPISTVCTPGMQHVWLEEVPKQVQLLSKQLDGLVLPVFHGLALSLCIVAATASSTQQLAEAQDQVDQGSRTLQQLAKALSRTGEVMWGTPHGLTELVPPVALMLSARTKRQSLASLQMCAWYLALRTILICAAPQCLARICTGPLAEL